MSYLPAIIQGGMGAGVSSWRLARSVAELGGLGVVSGTALDHILARRLQDGDPGGHMRRALDAFPFPALAARVRDAYFIRDGKQPAAPYLTLPMPVKESPVELTELTIVANFVEVFLAREGHANPVGINYLEKIQIPHLPSLYGAMLAGVGYVIVGAGIPLKFPDAIDRLARHEPATYPLHVTGAVESDDTLVRFDPRAFVDGGLAPLVKPRFIAIVSSNVLAATLVKKLPGRLDGLIVEGPEAGGHNAPPRGKLELDDDGSVRYGDRDCVDLEKIRALGVPFWLAGGYGSPERARAAVATGAAGVQIGTAFAYCAESGMRDDLKRAVIDRVLDGRARVTTDPLASPTNFPFKVVQVDGTMSDPACAAKRPRICDLGYLREAYRTPSGTIGYRCPGEPPNVYVAKGGSIGDTAGRACMCNALLATIGHAQRRKGGFEEPAIVTAGTGLPGIAGFVRPETRGYRAIDVIDAMAFET